MSGRRISAASVMAWDRDLLECVDVWARAGLAAIGLNLQQLAGSPERLVEQVRERGLAVSSVQGVRPFDLEHATIGSGQRADLLVALDLAAALGAECVVALAGPRGELSWDHAMDRLVEQTAQVLPEFQSRGLRLALEPMSPIRQDLSFVNLAADAVDIVRRVDDASFGYLFDTYHLWWQRDIDTLARATADNVFGVQVSDHKRVTMRALDRAMPGEGVIPLPGLLHALEDGGYDGWWELEVITDGVDGSDLEAVLHAAVRSVQAVW